MQRVDTLRRSGFPLLGLGILALVGPQLVPGSSEAQSSQTRTDDAYRDLWANDPARASRRLVSELRRDPASPERWCDLADALIESNRPDAARKSIQNAVAAGPGLPHIRMRAANLSFRLGDTTQGLRESGAAARESGEYELPAYQAWHRLGDGPDAVFRDAAPEPSLARGYFRWLTGSAEPEEVATAWKLLGHSVTEAETLAYIDYLVSRRDYSAAWVLQSTLRTPDGNLLHDGGLEMPLKTGGDGPGWHVLPLESVVAETDSSVFHDGHASLRLRFSGSNPEYAHVTQRLVVPQGVYKVSALIRTRALTSEQGISVRVADVDDSRRSSISVPVSGDTEWREVSATLAVGPGARLLEVSVARRASWGFDAGLSGSAWIDDVRLLRVGGNAHAGE